jgi:hypothetical protein
MFQNYQGPALWQLLFREGPMHRLQNILSVHRRYSKKMKGFSGGDSITVREISTVVVMIHDQFVIQNLQRYRRFTHPSSA